MEVRNTPPETPIDRLSPAGLLGELCTALRSVAVSEAYNPVPSERMERAIRRVQLVRDELVRRGIDYKARIHQLSDQTSWQMDRLLQESLQWPELTPRVREKDGILRHRRCSICQRREYPDLDQTTLCDDCLERTISAVSDRSPLDGVFLYRTYNASYWCPHANAETALAALCSFDDLEGRSFCLECLLAERESRVAVRT